MQTILGSGGIIANHLSTSLLSYTDKIRLVSRNPKAVTGKEELVSADLTSAEQVMKAVKGSEVVYLTAGLQYDIKVWQQQWPKLMQNVITACNAITDFTESTRNRLECRDEMCLRRQPARLEPRKHYLPEM